MAGFSGSTLGAGKRYTDEQIALYGTTGFIPKGSWDASTNTPHLEDGVGSLGWTYEVTVAGTQFGHNFLIGDKVFYNANNKWDRSATGVESKAPMVVAYVDENTEQFPTTRPSGQPLKNGDWVSVKSSAKLKFTIKNKAGIDITFDAYGDKAEFAGEDWQEKSYEAGKTNEIGIKNPTEEGITGDEEYQNELNKEFSNEIKIGKSVLSVKRLGEYLYEATYDGIADYVEGVNNVIGGCSTFVRGGKTYRSFDLNYNNVAEFIVKTKEFDGIALIQGMNDGELDKEKIAQLPYHLADGCNRHGIIVTEHILFNDFGFNGTGTKDNDLTKLPTIILQNVKLMAELTTNVVVNNFLANAKLPTALVDLGYALHFFITDNTTTYTLAPKDDGSGYEFIDISSLPKQTNFKWINRVTLDRNDSDLQSRAIGTTRWNLIESGAELKDLAFTKAYQTNERLDEFVGINGTTKDSTDAELQAIYEDAHTEYLTRKRDGKTWQSLHAIVYGSQGIEYLSVQENYDKNYIVLTGGCGDDTKY